MEALIYESEVEAMSAWMADFPRVETGGELFGLWTHTGAPVVMLAIGPGPRARHNATSFYQDTTYLETEHRRVWEGHGLVDLGNWHSHHHIGLAEPSGGDIASVWGGMASAGWGRFLLGIGNFPHGDERACTFGVFLFDQARDSFAHVPARILPGASPLRQAQRWKKPCPRWAIRDPRSLAEALPAAWYTEPAAQKRVAREIRSLQLLTELGIEHSVKPDGDRVVVELSGARTACIELLAGFPHRPPVTTTDWLQGPWYAEGSLADWVCGAVEAAEEAARADASEGASANVEAEEEGPAVESASPVEQPEPTVAVVDSVHEPVEIPVVVPVSGLYAVVLRQEPVADLALVFPLPKPSSPDGWLATAGGDATPVAPSHDFIEEYLARVSDAHAPARLESEPATPYLQEHR
ncbi:MAG: hypothetical protein V4850_32240 [Myxococcota bacterium]